LWVSWVNEQIMNKKEAKRLGMHKYWPDKSCRNGHMALRRTDRDSCVACLAQYRRERNRLRNSGTKIVKFRIHSDDEITVTEFVKAINLARNLTNGSR
jgi:hypothetical protein